MKTLYIQQHFHEAFTVDFKNVIDPAFGFTGSYHGHPKVARETPPLSVCELPSPITDALPKGVT